MKDETKADLEVALTEIGMLEEKEMAQIAFAGQMAAEAILCALPPGGPLDQALERLREVDELVWATACVAIGRWDGSDGGLKLYAARWHDMGEANKPKLDAVAVPGMCTE